MVKVLIKLLNDIDPSSAQQFGMVPELVFLKHFMNGFQELFTESVTLAILDLIFLFGSGSQTATISEPEPVNVSDTHPLCRTS